MRTRKAFNPTIGYPHFLLLLCFLLMLSCSERGAVDSVDLYVPEDLEATLWAESPMFYNPTNLDVDAKGRIWLTEAVNYRNYNNDSTAMLHHAGGDRVMILEDTDHDGHADYAKVFVQDRDLVSPLGIAVVGKQVIVSCSPHLIVYTDFDGDDKPDKKEIILTGFGGLDHDHSLHAVVVGPDGDWYFNTGNAGPHVVTDRSGWTLRSGSIYTGGSPYNVKNQGNLVSDDGKVWVGGLALRMRPDGTGLKVMAHNFRNSYESAIDSYGNIWQNDNDDQVVACRTTWVMEGGNAGFFSQDGTRYWQADQRPWQDIFVAHWHQDDPGIMPAGDRSGAGAPTGIVRNEGDALGAKYDGLLLSADAGRNTIFGYLPSRRASGYDLGTRSNFITSLAQDNEGYVWNDSTQNAMHDKWFRPSDVCIGTDGALYVADWYDPVVGGHQMTDSLGYGRIYRITPKGKRNMVPPSLDLSTVEGLLKAMYSPAVNVRGTAVEILKKDLPSARVVADSLLRTDSPWLRARATWLMSFDPERVDELRGLLSDHDEMVRATSWRALARSGNNMVSLAKSLIDDSSAFVRRELMITMRDWGASEKESMLLTLATQYKGSDKWYLGALSAAAKGMEDRLYRQLLDVKRADPRHGEKWDDAMAELVGSLHPREAIIPLRSRAASAECSLQQRTDAQTAIAFINTPEAVRAMLSLATIDSDTIASRARYWLAFRQSNAWADLIDWKTAGLNVEAERKINTMRVKRSKVLDEKLPMNEKKWNARDMARDEIGGRMLLTMVTSGSLPGELQDEILNLLLANPDLGIRTPAQQLKYTAESAALDGTQIAQLTGDASRGQKLFEEKCAVCHRVGGTGRQVGPDLSAIGQKFDRQAIADAIARPNAGIVFGYEVWRITNREGISYYGFIVAEDERHVTLKDLGGTQQSINLADIISREKSVRSAMPRPEMIDIKEQDIADITSFLARQTLIDHP